MVFLSSEYWIKDKTFNVIFNKTEKAIQILDGFF
jgi:hypothetical protein